MIRAIALSPYATQLTNETTQLVESVKSIVNGTWLERQAVTHVLPNYLHNAATSNFADTAGTALMVAATYRLAQFGYDSTWIPQAEMARLVVQQSVDSYGWLHNVVVRDVTVRYFADPRGRTHSSLTCSAHNRPKHKLLCSSCKHPGQIGPPARTSRSSSSPRHLACVDDGCPLPSQRTLEHRLRILDPRRLVIV